ncbi:helix-turn-helix domain-containing protein [Myxococcus faecalis]|uniref:helix-turn-helix domain-containing protein n=1 Tax=Myxococcus faecalis TaxID=3115646 RepID=UPI003CE9CE57
MLTNLDHPVALPPEKRPIAEQIHRQLTQGKAASGARPKSPVLLFPNGAQVELPPEAAELLRTLFAALAKGEPVSIVPSRKALTTQQAADFLNISRQGLVNLCESGKIKYTRSVKHRRILFEDLLRYKQQRDEARASGLRELTQLSEDDEDYYS